MKPLKCLLVIALGAALLTACASSRGGSPPDEVRDFVLIAHRGASGHAPENTLAAFRLAAESRADYFEIDCRLSKDGQVVLVHDADLERTAGHAAEVGSLSLEELKLLDVGSWFGSDFTGERIPTLVESLDAATADCGVYVEIKSEAGDGAASAALVGLASGEQAMTPALRDSLLALVDRFDTQSPELTRACIADIRARGMEKRVVIQSFSPLICFIARSEAPEIRTELLLSDNKDNPNHFDAVADFGLLIGVEGINVSKDSLTPERLARFHAAGKTVAVYTLNDLDQMAKFLDMGVDGVITDFPQEAHTRFRTPR